MAFTVFGAGIRDNVPFNISANLEEIEETFPTNPIKKVGARGDEEAPEKQTNLLTLKNAGKAYSSTYTLPKDRGPALHAHQIMTSPVVTLFKDATITQAWALFREKRFRHVPIISRDRKIYGILSDRDLLRYAAVSGKIPPYAENAPEASTDIASLLKTRVITASQDTEIRQIARILFEQRVGVMPIVSESGSIDGIITRSDILRTLINHAPLELWV